MGGIVKAALPKAWTLRVATKLTPGLTLLTVKI